MATVPKKSEERPPKRPASGVMIVAVVVVLVVLLAWWYTQQPGGPVARGQVVVTINNNTTATISFGVVVQGGHANRTTRSDWTTFYNLTTPQVAPKNSARTNTLALATDCENYAFTAAYLNVSSGVVTSLTAYRDNICPGHATAGISLTFNG